MPPIQNDDDIKGFGDDEVAWNHPKSSKTVIFWDWDDTLLCSSYLVREGHMNNPNYSPPEALERQLLALETSVRSVLERAMQFGDVHVVTNAEMGWVQLSAQKYMPGLLPLLQKLPVLSARTTFQDTFPDSPLKWKFCAFQQQLAPFMSNIHSYKNVLSFGDSHVEREAVRAATRGCPRTRTKIVKFAERPSILQLQHQIDLIYWCFQSIHDHGDDLDLALTIQEDEGCVLPEIPLQLGPHFGGLPEHLQHPVPINDDDGKDQDDPDSDLLDEKMDENMGLD